MFTFTEELLTGIDQIDNAHHLIIQQASKVEQLELTTTLQPEVHDALYFLEEYVIVHFDEEETLQRNANYPDYPSHKNFHDLFKDRLEALIERHDANPTSLDIKQQVVHLFGEIFYTHIKTMDMQLAAYLRSQESS